MKGDCCAVVFQGRVGLALGLGPSTWVLVAKVGAEQNACTSYTRRRRGITAVDGGSIPPISTMRVAIARCWDAASARRANPDPALHC